jgi:hypothetical protein
VRGEKLALVGIKFTCRLADILWVLRPLSRRALNP